METLKKMALAVTVIVVFNVLDAFILWTCGPAWGLDFFKLLRYMGALTLIVGAVSSTLSIMNGVFNGKA